MKLFVVIFSLTYLLNSVNLHRIGETSTLLRPTKSLKDHLNDFIALIPQQKIVNIALIYIVVDSETIAVKRFIQSDEFKGIWRDVFANEDIIKLIDFFANNGIELKDAINKIAEFLNLPTYPISADLGDEPTDLDNKITGGFKGFFTDIIRVIPVDEFKNLYYNKIANSPEFKEFIDKIQSDEFKNIILGIGQSSELKAVVAKIKENGIDIVDIVHHIISSF